jgi:hypothetical protein
MRDTYAVLLEVEPVKKVESHKPVVVSLMKQTVECGYFIRDYAKVKNFCMLFPLLDGTSSYGYLFRDKNREKPSVGC